MTLVYETLLFGVNQYHLSHRHSRFLEPTLARQVHLIADKATVLSHLIVEVSCCAVGRLGVPVHAGTPASPCPVNHCGNQRASHAFAPFVWGGEQVLDIAHIWP